jgi:hemolysin activation/secretion protein
LKYGRYNRIEKSAFNRPIVSLFSHSNELDFPETDPGTTRESIRLDFSFAARASGRRGRWPSALIGLICFLTASSPAPAQDLPGIAARQLQRQQQQEKAREEEIESSRPDVRLLPKTAVASDAFPAGESPCFIVSRVDLQTDGNRQFAFAAASADDVLGRCMGSAGLNAVIARVQNALIAQGFVTTRVFAPPQDLRTGTLLLTVVPGRIRAVRFGTTSGPDASWHSPTLANALPAGPGDILNIRDIEQALENFKRVPTVEVDVNIEPGEQPGESDLVVQWRQASPLRVGVSVDDSGARATGKLQGNVTLALDNALGWNDLAHVSVGNDLSGSGDGGARGTRNYAAHYSVPMGNWLIAATASHYRYVQSIAGANQNYEYSGTSTNADVKLSRMMYRDASRKLSLFGRIYRRASENFIDDTEVEVQRRRMAGYELGATHKEFIGQGTLEAALAYRQGVSMLGATPAPEELFNEGTARPRIFTADVALNMPFALAGQRLHYLGVLRGQSTSSALIPQDRFAIGGRYTVRGFDGEANLLAARGWLLRNDLSAPIGDSGQQFFVGLDYGAVSGPETPDLAGTRLAGAVVGLRGQWQRLQYELFVGTPIYKPDAFETASVTSGFSLSLNF